MNSDDDFVEGMIRLNEAPKLPKPADWVAMSQWASTLSGHAPTKSFFAGNGTSDTAELVTDLESAISAEAPEHLTDSLNDLLGELEAVGSGTVLCT